ncbi:TonB-linked SusC/RagA family outer membrane protein [Dysgonomonas alginatilytica]|uniref:TonB-linked SusC/RagA family outer membrane protein n=1 Tax=Dysgonomonas alginatilytica TaxID=1605892 RepID=A0A2V3PWA1_9BACT|nr:TonB-dependent receptor [Dysgonomonas alginatilytica]PXV69121.1 TonB-linked SusC/RagA family outer membrane protein [Dysgonomonas alginatilytica]
MKHSSQNKYLRKVFSLKILFLLLSGFVSVASAQAQITITGTVIDAQNEPMIGISVILKNTSKGTVTDLDGKYTISVPDNKSVLVYSFISYKTQEIVVGTQRIINVKLEDAAAALDEVVVVGYGTQKKSDLTGGISTISSDKINKIPAVSLGQRLQGQIAGLNVTSINNRPGEDATFTVRGEKSLSGGNNPLIILDGIPFNGNITEVDQNSVDNISVLRDASSAAIYGSRAANGVILITTKKGKVGKPTVRYNAYVGFQQAEWLPDLRNGTEYIQMLKDFRRDTNDPKWDDPKAWLQLSLVDNFENGRETDWKGELFRTALQQEHQLSLSGATDATNYFVSLSYSDQDGIVKYTGYKKYAVTSNISQKIGNWLNIGANIQLLERDRGGKSPNFGYGFRMSPYGDVRDENGRYIRYPMNPETMYYSPFADQDAIVDDVSRAAYTNAFLDVKLPVKGLTYRANFGYSYRHRDRGSYYGSTTMTGEPIGGRATVRDDSDGDWTWENVVRYDNNWGKHHLDLTGLYSAQKTYTTYHETVAEGFLSDANGYHNIETAQGKKTIASTRTETALLSWMGRANYSYDRRYLLTVTARRDGYSAFGDNNKWALFPSVAGAWVLSEESFFQDLNWKQVEFLKFRLSYGSNGNQAVSAYQTKTKLAQRDYIYGNDALFAGGLVANFTKGNPNLKWETSSSLNAGIDFNLFNNVLSGSFDYYDTRTKDLLMNRTVPVMNGYTTMMDNVGKTKNTGFDFTLNTLNIKNQNFQWSSTFVLSGNWSKILELKDYDPKTGKPLDDVTNKWFIGQPIRVHYDYKVIGIWQEDEREEAAKYKAIPGDAKLYDKDNSGTITADDRVIIGSKLPVWTAGLTNTFSYKNLSLSVFLNGVFDVTKENETVKFERQLFAKNVNYINGINYWTPENRSNEYTRLGYNETKHTFYTKASFVRIQDVNLSYQFPKVIAKKIGLEALTTYVNARNLYTFSGAKKFTTNIEQDKYSLDSPDIVVRVGDTPRSSYPNQRVFIIGVNVTF